MRSFIDVCIILFCNNGFVLSRYDSQVAAATATIMPHGAAKAMTMVIAAIALPAAQDQSPKVATIKPSH
jgi:hypothetical protein